MKPVAPIHLDKITETCAAQPTRQGPRALPVDLCLPRAAEAPAPLLVRMHAGGFRSGTRRNLKHGAMADAPARRGHACAFTDYRLAGPRRSCGVRRGNWGRC